MSANPSPNLSHVAAAAALLGIEPGELRRRLSGEAAPVAKDRLLRVREVASILGVSTRTVQAMLASKRLPRIEICPASGRHSGGWKVGGRVGIPLSAVESLMRPAGR